MPTIAGPVCTELKELSTGKVGFIDGRGLWTDEQQEAAERVLHQGATGWLLADEYFKRSRTVAVSERLNRQLARRSHDQVVRTLGAAG